LRHRDHAGAQRVGRARARGAHLDGVAQRDQPAILGFQCGIGGELGLDFDHAAGVEFAVQSRVEKKHVVFALRGHARLPRC
jgi:hypothetical protein